MPQGSAANRKKIAGGFPSKEAAESYARQMGYNPGVDMWPGNEGNGTWSVWVGVGAGVNGSTYPGANQKPGTGGAGSPQMAAAAQAVQAGGGVQAVRTTGAAGGGGGGGSQVTAAAGADEEWLGINTAVSPTKLNQHASPNCENFEGIQETGALSVRPGMSKCAIDKDVVGASLSLMGGRAICDLQFMDSSGQNAMLAVWDKGDTEPDETVSVIAGVLGQTLTIGPLNPGDEAPTMTLTSGSGNVTVALAAAENQNWIKQVVIRYSTVGFPLKIDGGDDRASTAAHDHVSWDGSAANFALTAPAAVAARVYVTAWAVGYERVSLMAHGSILVA